MSPSRMMLPNILLLISAFLSSTTEAGLKECTGERSPCQIPFSYKGQMYFECTTEAPGGEADLFGRCPLVLKEGTSPLTREASTDAKDWVRCDKATCPLQQYTGNKEVETHMRDLVDRFPNLARLVVVGKSTLGQNITGVRITSGLEANGQRQLLKPMVRYSGNMHGNEPVGREMLNHFASVLLHGYGIVDEITQLVDTTDITIIPTINPDGFDRGKEGACSGADYKTGRYNEGDVDLNRSFPTWADVNKTRDQLYNNREPETKAMMNLIMGAPWVLSANFHDGAVVASYPYDDYQGRRRQSGLSVTPDHSFFKHLASTYANNHQTMLDQPDVCKRWYFKEGITNGADWYALYGGMQDFNYIFTNDFEITMELSCCKYPRSYYLNKEWEKNKVSLIRYLQQVHRGVKGLVYTTLLEGGANGNNNGNDNRIPLPNAIIAVTDNEGGPIAKNITSSSRGEYWRLLMPGQYKITGYHNLCDTAGLILTSAGTPVTITDQSPLVIMDLVLDNVQTCPPRR